MSTLAIIGFVMVCVFMYLIMSKRLSAMNALILVPLLFGIGLGLAGMAPLGKLGSMVMDGIRKAAPTGIMIMFAILYFGTMIDAGLFDPLINKILKVTHGDPLKVIVGTALLAGIVSLDGDGATTYMIVTSAMLAVHKRIGINPIILPTVAIMQNGVMNILPWGGPTGRVMSALGLDASQVFVPMIPGMVVGTIWVMFWAYLLGMKERARLGTVTMAEAAAAQEYVVELDEDSAKLKRPHLFWANLGLTALLMAALVSDKFPLAVLFMVGTALALMINYPNLKTQQELIMKHGMNAIPTVSLVVSAGVLMGIMSGTKMVDAMANSLTSSIPASMGSHIALITALAGLPFDYFLSNDAFYFGIVPILAKTAANYGIGAAEIARASLIAQGCHLLSPLVASTYLLCGMSGVTLGDLTKSALLPSIGTSLVMLATALALGLFPI
ncbi:citrate/H+ symporter, CitMHS family [Thermosinus carboxydivorans Nor1]|uniref:Citrate/H+ symporter, CitMHS family n=1 Tax=Thermosinus carboxydivorans Nor1 TaxID=401526 RepID=A1HNF9_9FIRM|nr:citrate/H+ symporter, CitMHS family [Thermosinus carboxydivorans Nor1]